MPALNNDDIPGIEGPDPKGEPYGWVCYQCGSVYDFSVDSCPCQYDEPQGFEPVEGREDE